MRVVFIPITLFCLLPAATRGQDGNAHDPLGKQLSEKERGHIIVEKKPEYPGGFGAFYKYINKNLKYPKAAKKSKVSGKVFVEFAVTSDGSIDDDSIRTLEIDELNEKGWSTEDFLDNIECEFEAMRLLKECADWNPALQKGKAVSVIMTLPITFELQKR